MRGAADRDEPMAAFGDYCSGRAGGGGAAADAGVMMRVGLADCGPRPRRSRRDAGPGAGSGLLSSILRGGMAPLRSPAEDQEASLLRRSYVAPEQNSMQMILHPDAAGAGPSAGAGAGAADARAAFRALRAGFLLPEPERDARACVDGNEMEDVEAFGAGAAGSSAELHGEQMVE